MVSKHCVKKLVDIPGPPRLPFIGSLHLYKTGKFEIRKYHKVLQDLYGTYGPIVRQDLGATTTIHVFEPGDIQTVYRNEGESPLVAPLLDTAKHYRQKNNLSLGLGNTNGEEWYRLRSAIRKMMLRPTEVHYYLPSVYEVAKKFVGRLSERRNVKGEVHNLSKEAGKWVMESAGFICFEESVGSLNGGDSEKECEAMIDANQTIFEISAQLKFSLPVYKYISTPKIRKLISAEDFFYKFYPIGTEVSRIANKDLLLSGYEIPKGTRLDLTSNVHFMSDKYFKDAESFQPDRWMKSRSQHNINPFLLTPFGHGTRTCAGRRFAEQDLFVALSLILKKFHLKLTHQKPLEQVYASLLLPDGPLMVQFIPR